MSYTYLLEQGEESSAECFSDMPASVLESESGADMVDHERWGQDVQ